MADAFLDVRSNIPGYCFKMLGMFTRDIVSIDFATQKLEECKQYPTISCSCSRSIAEILFHKS